MTARSLRLAGIASSLRPAAALLIGAVIALALAVSRAQAQSCSVTAASGSYGNVNVLSGATDDSTSTFTVSCSGPKNSTVRLCIEMSAGSPTDSGKRALSNGTKYLDHEFYTNASRTQVWGSWGAVVTAYGTGGVQQDLALGSTGSASVSLTVYARVLASQQSAAPLSYTWSATSPGIRYGKSGTSACPTGNNTTSGGTTTWTATVPANCLVSATAVNFGSAGVIAANTDASGTTTVQCTSTTPYTVALNGGNSGATDPTKREMSKATETITYGLYRDSARSLPWGSTTGTNTVGGTGTGSNQPLTVYGRVASQATPSPGTYTDSVIVTVTY
jgi:spore coat protein U-like protein